MTSTTTNLLYQVRELEPGKQNRPEDRGTPVSYHATFAEASAAAQRLALAGRCVFVARPGVK